MNDTKEKHFPYLIAGQVNIIQGEEIIVFTDAACEECSSCIPGVAYTLGRQSLILVREGHISASLQQAQSRGYETSCCLAKQTDWKIISIFSDAQDEVSSISALKAPT